MAVTTLDLTKAFDTVSHHSIERAQRRKGIELGTISYIMATLKNDTTIIRVNRDTTKLPTKIARIETQSLKIVSIRETINPTGLTVNQIRSCREKPIYKKYLEQAKRERASLTEVTLLTTV